MRCPYCDHEHSSVVDSREVEAHQAVRRRRECLRCGKRFTTYERVEMAPIVVVKRSGVKEAFSRDVLVQSIASACEKLSIGEERIAEVANVVERGIRSQETIEVESALIGELVMRELRELDPVAYLRYVSVFRGFRNVDAFLREAQAMMEERGAGLTGVAGDESEDWEAEPGEGEVGASREPGEEEGGGSEVGNVPRAEGPKRVRTRTH